MTALALIETPVEPAVGGVRLDLDAITHRFSETLAVDDVSLSVEPGEFVVFLGPSGCGKTTLLRIIAGFTTASQGSVRIGGRPVENLPPDERGIGIVFQNYALFPHMNVAANIEYGLRARGVRRAKRKARVAEMLRFVHLDDLAERYPRQLSGGQQQRVALARALAPGPQILLLDEPFGALDKNLRLDMQIELKRIQQEAGITTIMVTHDQEEALSLADRIAVFRQGRLEQYGTPQEIYDKPLTRFVSGFVGHTNLLQGRLVSANPAEIALDLGTILRLPEAKPCERLGRVTLSVRPENLTLSTGATKGGLSGRVRAALPFGATIVYEVEAADGTMLKALDMRAGRQPLAVGSPVTIGLADSAHCRVYID